MSPHRHTHVVPFRTRLKRFLGRMIRRCCNKIRGRKPVVCLLFGAGNSGKGYSAQEILKHIKAHDLVGAIVDMGDRFRAESDRFKQWTDHGILVPNEEVEKIVFDEMGKLLYAIDILLLIGLPRNEMQIAMAHHALDVCDFDDRHCAVIMEAELDTLLASAAKRNRGKDDSPEVVTKRYYDWINDNRPVAEKFAEGCHKVFRHQRETITTNDRLDVSQFLIEMLGETYDPERIYRMPLIHEHNTLMAVEDITA
jgi:adenylate kinase family enzyme